MIKYLLITCGILSLTCILLFIGYDNRGMEITKLKVEKDNIILKFKECQDQYKTDQEFYKNAQKSSAEIIKNLRNENIKLSGNNTMDCYNSVMPIEYRELLNNLQ